MEFTLERATVYTGNRHKTTWWVCAVMTSLSVLFLIFDFGIKFTTNDAVVTSFIELGFPISLVFGLVIVLLGLPALQSSFVRLLGAAFGLLRNLSTPGA